MEAVDDDVWGAVSPPATSLSLHLLAPSGAPFHPVIPSPLHPGAVCYRNVAAPPSSSFLPAAAFPFPPGGASPFYPAAVCYHNVAAPPSSFLAPLHAGPSSAATAASGSEERRKKRLIKSRETASRSRARKHTHVTKVESEVAELREANEQLRVKYEKLKAAVEVSMPVRKTLQRMLSAPF